MWLGLRQRKQNSDEDWSQYRLLRNKCTKSIKSSKSQYYLNLINNNMKVPFKFWKLTKSLVGSNKSTDLPKALKLNQSIITDKVNIVNMFNSFFFSASSIQTPVIRWSLMNRELMSRLTIVNQIYFRLPLYCPPMFINYFQI